MNCLKYINISNFLDRFRRPILFYSNNSTRPSTKFGLVISLALYGFAIYSFLTSDIIERKNPKTFDQEVETNNRPEILLRNLVFSIENEKGKAFYDPDIFTLRVNFEYLRKLADTKNGYDNIYSIGEELRRCKEDDFEKGVFTSMAFENRLCINNKSLATKGYWDEKDLKYFYVSLTRCDNLTNKNSCKSNEEIDEYFSMKKLADGVNNHKYMQIYFLNNFVDLNDKHSAMKNSWRTDYNLLDINIYKSWKLYFKKVEFKEDENLPFFSIKMAETYSYDKKETDIIIQQRAPILFLMNFYSSNIVQKKSRTYQGLSEAFANLWGILGVFTIVGLILTEPMLNLELIQSIFKERRFYSNDNLNSKPAFPNDILGIKAANEEQKQKRPSKYRKKNSKTENFPYDPADLVPNSFVKKDDFSIAKGGVPSTNSKQPDNINSYLKQFTAFQWKGERVNSRVNTEQSVLSEGEASEQIFKCIKTFPNNKFNDKCKQSSKPADSPKEGDVVEIGDINIRNSNAVNSLEINRPDKNSEPTCKIANGQSFLEHKEGVFLKFLNFFRFTCKKKKPVLKQKHFFPFTLLEFFKLNLKKIFGMKLTSRELIFKRIMKTHKRELNIAILLQRIFILEKKTEFILSLQNDLQQFEKQRKFSFIDILNH